MKIMPPRQPASGAARSHDSPGLNKPDRRRHSAAARQPAFGDPLIDAARSRGAAVRRRPFSPLMPIS
jgi:hypothetical protein